MEVSPVFVTVIVSVVVALVGGVTSVWFRLEGKFSGEREARDKRAAIVDSRFEDIVVKFETVRLDATNRYALLVRELADYRLLVAENYVHRSDLKETEIRLVGAIEKMSSSMEKMMARLDGISNKLERP